MRHTLVTGGAGFLGSHLCTRLLEAGHRVSCVDNFHTGSAANVVHLMTGAHARYFELIRHDVVDPLYAEVDEIYHLACPASPQHYLRNPVRTLKTAVLGTMNVLDLAQQTGARVLVASSSEIYGEPQVHPQREDDGGHVGPTGRRACHDEGKRCGEALAAAYASQHGVQVRIARIFNTYGPRMHEEDGRVVPTFIAQALREEPITVFGDGSQTRSLCFQSDLVSGLVALMATATDPGPVNLGNPEEMTVRDLATLVLELTGSRSPIETRPQPPDDPTRRRPDIAKARRVLGWEPRVSAREGIAETIDYYRKRLPVRVTPSRTRVA